MWSLTDSQSAIPLLTHPVRLVFYGSKTDRDIPRSKTTSNAERTLSCPQTSKNSITDAASKGGLSLPAFAAMLPVVSAPATRSSLALYRSLLKAVETLPKHRQQQLRQRVRGEFRENRHVSEQEAEDLRLRARDALDNVVHYAQVFERGDRLHYGSLKEHLPCGS
ncbi:hypothetical protein FVE85_8474 [Porphyridium purpureum]|uniref:Complex 1 LYR protein domain-containing protein n=1 Tax=Porphyridium purpureum TaxID=35688 RepID=A0A5J4YLV3_PORPP|nr:hypothetical protein FVE85_8474 [Porphyridium purpureum]|eukprot:POR7215..scf244_11